MSSNARPVFTYPFLTQPPSPVAAPTKHRRQASEHPVHPVLINLPLPAVPVTRTPPASPKRLVRRASTTFSAIRNWAEQVAPGSPGSPSKTSHSSRKLSFSSGSRNLSRRGSTVSIHLTSSPRRPSAISISHKPSGSFLNLHTPSIGDEKHGEGDLFDLTALGYTTNFVHLPKTPETPEEFLALAKLQKQPPPASGTPKSASAGVISFRSLNVLKPFRGRSKSQSGGDIGSPTVNINMPSCDPIPPVPTLPAQFKDSSSKGLKRGFGSFLPSRSRSATASKPKPIMNQAEREVYQANILAQHVAMASFIGGGPTKHHAIDIAKEQARAHNTSVTMPVKVDGQFFFSQEDRDEQRALLGDATSLTNTSHSSSRHGHGHGHRSSRRGSAASTSFGPVVQQETDYSRMPYVPPPSSGDSSRHHHQHSSSSSSRHRKNAPASLALHHSNYRPTKQDSFEDNFVPRTAA